MTALETVSIVIPVRNGERFLAEAIESALGQEHGRVEVIVVDDGSTDRSADVAEGYGVQVLRQAPRGPGAARNAGVAASAGSYVTFLDSDDVMLPRKASAQLSYLHSHPEVGCVRCRQEIFLEEGTKAPDWLIPDRFFGDVDGLPPTSSMVRAEVARRFPFDESMPVAEDLDWLVRMRAGGVGIHVMPEILVRRRIHGANMTHRTRDGHTWLIRSLRRSIAKRREGG